MLHLHEVVSEAEGAGAPVHGSGGPGAREGVVTLTFEERRKSRLLATLDDGREVGLLLPRGTVLRHGDRLRGDDGLLVEVRAAAESLSVGATADWHQLARAAYHLGNRHVPLEIGEGFVAYAHDHVLDDMVRGLGLEVSSRVAPFEPETGAFQHAASGGGAPAPGPEPHHHHHPHAHHHHHPHQD